MLRYDFRAMGCQMTAVLDTDADDAREAMLQVAEWFAGWEASLSRFRADSELAALNRAAGQPMHVSETLWQVLQASLDAARDSAGWVTPTLLDAVQAAGYDRSFELLESSSPPGGSSVPSPARDWREIELDANTRRVRLPAGMHLDFGGVAKGWAADQAAQRLSVIAPALVDAGGDIATGAVRPNGEPWPISIADPFKPDSDLQVVLLGRGGVATSGRDYRRWKRNGIWQHHIINPRTGAPAETDVLAATVIAPATIAAEVGAKVALILGSKPGLEWIEARKELAALLVLADGRIVASERMADYVWNESPSHMAGPLVLPSWS